MLVRVRLPSWVLISSLCFMFYVYILQSQGADRSYIGYSEAPDRRLSVHNSGKVKSTRNFRPWKKVYQEEFETELLAIRRERYIKSMKSKKFIQQLVDTSRLYRDEQ
jgi:putative endonuclease